MSATYKINIIIDFIGPQFTNSMIVLKANRGGYLRVVIFLVLLCSFSNIAIARDTSAYEMPRCSSIHTDRTSVFEDRYITASYNSNVNDKFKVPSEIQLMYPDIVALVKDTDIMDDAEKQYWFDILPQMSDVQIEKLKDLLVTDKKKTINK